MINELEMNNDGPGHYNADPSGGQAGHPGTGGPARPCPPSGAAVEKFNILFVDDEQNILDSMRLMLRSMRHQWNTAFADSGEAALALMETRRFDVIVSDVRMPGMDGARLLSIVAERWPETVRMVLSGYFDQASVISTVKLTHQYLSKPCSPEEVISAISKALRLREVITCESLKRLVSRIESLPALPDLYQKLIAELQDESSSMQRIGDIISQDVTMTSSILRLVNSAFFGLPTHVNGVHHAVKLLGVDTIRVLVLGIGLFSRVDPSNLGFSLEELWAHSLRVSCFCKAIAEVEGLGADAREDCFVAGLLHDLGKLVLASTMPEEYARALARVAQGGVHVHEAEHEVFRIAHGEVGAYLLSLWGFKDAVIEAVCWHHHRQRLSCDVFNPLLVLAVSDAFDHELVRLHPDRDWRAGTMLEFPKEEYMARLKDWRGLCAQTLARESAC